ncbi:hypothetical protein CCO03_02535 [Comamonas serinivorans]|uniref:DUF2946 domain-containing protein n=1 Tax=Comamonas serinivorans TaxID=1082851 RepID=A0A1Y0EJW3_9BURK|nr:DUF2946 family protein [Comamonas serinivorans]ARU03711.1 hypothetical protein CCO03_02535 [Comamonas serinivorans]
MDDIVKQAMAKWPNVPDCHGWLGLDARGDWYLRDAQAQAQGAFTSGRPGAKGDVIRLTKLIEFIGRNYDRDARGCWSFQNGPQRVFVELEAAPWVLRLSRDEAGRFTVHTHTGRAVQAQAPLIDEHGQAYLHTDAGLGLVHTLDMHVLADALEAGHWPEPEALTQAELGPRFGFVASPQALASDAA